MAYSIDTYSGGKTYVVEDGTIDSSLDIKLIGKNYAGYGEVQNENFVHLLENFAGVTQPPRPLAGQIWYDTSAKKIKFYDASATKFRAIGGAEVADYAQYFLPFSRLMRDIGPSSWAMKQAKKIKIQHPWTNIVTVKGQSPFILAANDGVVTIASQKHHEDMELVPMDYNHYEVVLADPVIDVIKERVKQFKK
jgi:hypothetical protein